MSRYMHRNAAGANGGILVMTPQRDGGYGGGDYQRHWQPTLLFVTARRATCKHRYPIDSATVHPTRPTINQVTRNKKKKNNDLADYSPTNALIRAVMRSTLARKIAYNPFFPVF